LPTTVTNVPGPVIGAEADEGALAAGRAGVCPV